MSVDDFSRTCATHRTCARDAEKEPAMTFANAYGETLSQYLSRRAAMVWRKLQSDGPLQVRWEHDVLVTAPFPAPETHKHGVFGALIGVYTPSARLEWIESDFIAFGKSLSATSTTATA